MCEKTKIKGKRSWGQQQIISKRNYDQLFQLGSNKENKIPRVFSLRKRILGTEDSAKGCGQKSTDVVDIMGFIRYQKSFIFYFVTFSFSFRLSGQAR